LAAPARGKREPYLLVRDLKWNASSAVRIRGRIIAQQRPPANCHARQSDFYLWLLRVVMCAFCSGAVQKVAQAAIKRLRRSNRSDLL
jgi:hypothetical protein